MDTTSVDVRTATTIAEQLADHVVGLRFDDLPAPVVDTTKELLVLHLGVAFAGRLTERGRLGARIAFHLSNGAGDTTIIGERSKANVLDAVFANSAMINAQNLGDFHPKSGTHPGVVVIPAALALAEQQRRTGAELLTAIVLGYDLLCGLASTASTWGARSPRRPNSVFGAFGPAAAAARLLGLERAQVAHAMGHAAHSGMGVIEGVGELWHIWPRIARAGVLSAQLARMGARTAPLTIEGDNGMFRTFFDEVPSDLGTQLGRLGREFEITKAATKRFQSSGRNIVPLQLMLGLIESGNLDPSTVRRVRVVLPEQVRPNHMVMEAELTEQGRSAQSLRFLLSLVLVDGALDASRYDDLHDPRIQETLPKVQLDFEPDRPFLYARLEIETSGGERQVVDADSYEFPPIDRGAWLRKDGAKFLAADKLDRLERLIGSLETVDDASQVGECLRP